MPPRKDLCRNFQRGSCQYGARCKFIHDTSSQGAQQSSSNQFGFGAQTSTPFQPSNQQQTRNPYGFGVQNNNQPRGANDFGSSSTQPKPLQNTWSRFSPLNSSAPASRPSGPTSQPPPSHKCTSPDACKQVIVEDFGNEKPLWKLTCYGHNKEGPCDIVGDISPEELRALAYDDAKQGKSLQLIVERERNLLNSKFAEFQNLLQKPYAISSSAALSTQSPFAGTHSNSITNSGFAPPVSSFSQLAPSLNTGSAAAPSYAFGQPSAMQNNTHPSSMLQNNTNTSNVFQANNGSGAFGPQLSTNRVTNPFSFGTGSSSNTVASPHKNLFSAFGNSTQFGNAAMNQFQSVPVVSPAPASAVEMSSISTDNLPNNNNVDETIWAKSEWSWNKGEIPEQEPPDIHVH